MKTHVSPTSIDAIHAIRNSGITGTQRQKIIDCLARFARPLTRGQIAAATGIDKCSVAGRVNGMIKDGLLCEPDRVICPISQRICYTVQIISVAG